MLKILNRLTMACLLIGGVVTLGGCIPHDLYVQPPGLSSSNAATIIGSRGESQNPIGSDFPVYIVRIDDTPTYSGIKGWNKPVILTPGSHQICFGIRLNNGDYGLLVGAYEFEAGKTYTLRGSPSSSMADSPSLYFGWIEGPDGQRVGDRIAVNVRPYVEYNPVYVPIIIYKK